jgi:hypothetical protein
VDVKFKVARQFVSLKKINLSLNEYSLKPFATKLAILGGRR